MKLYAVAFLLCCFLNAAQSQIGKFKSMRLRVITAYNAPNIASRMQVGHLSCLRY
jgi:hypothetical protein